LEVWCKKSIFAAYKFDFLLKAQMLSFFGEQSIASAFIFLSLISVSGILLGKIKIFNIKLGIVGVLFTGIAFGHFGAQIIAETLNFIKEFGLILFIFSIGLDIGPRFLSSFKNNGIVLNLLSTTVVLLGFGMAILLSFIYSIDVEDRKSTRLNSSHVKISYAVFCLKKKTETHQGLRSRTEMSMRHNQRL